jgi:hypothetical protein
VQNADAGVSDHRHHKDDVRQVLSGLKAPIATNGRSLGRIKWAKRQTRTAPSAAASARSGARHGSTMFGAWPAQTCAGKQASYEIGRAFVQYGKLLNFPSRRYASVRARDHRLSAVARERARAVVLSIGRLDQYKEFAVSAGAISSKRGWECSPWAPGAGIAREDGGRRRA